MDIQVLPLFSKVHFAPLYSYERPTSVHVFANPKKPQEDFHFYRKTGKQKQHLACFAAACYQGRVHPSTARLLLQEPRSVSQHQAPTVVDRVTGSVSICTPSRFIFFTHWQDSPMVIVSLLLAISA